LVSWSAPEAQQEISRGAEAASAASSRSPRTRGDMDRAPEGAPHRSRAPSARHPEGPASGGSRRSLALAPLTPG